MTTGATKVAGVLSGLLLMGITRDQNRLVRMGGAP